MGLIIALATFSAIAVRLYRGLTDTSNAYGAQKLEGLKGQAATIAAFAKAFFDVLQALTTNKPPVTIIAAPANVNNPLRDAGGYPRPRLQIGATSAVASGISTS